MSNPNIKRNVRNLSAATLGLAAVGEGVKSVTSHSKPPVAPLVKTVNIEPVKGKYVTVTEISSAKKSPVIDAYPLQNTFDEGNEPIVAAVKPGKLDDHIESAKFSLTYPKEVPAGVSIGKSRLVDTHQGEEVVAQFNDPSDPNLHSGEVEVNVTATESNGATSTVQEEIPYSPQPAPPF